MPPFCIYYLKEKPSHTGQYGQSSMIEQQDYQSVDYVIIYIINCAVLPAIDFPSLINGWSLWLIKRRMLTPILILLFDTHTVAFLLQLSIKTNKQYHATTNQWIKPIIHLVYRNIAWFWCRTLRLVLAWSAALHAFFDSYINSISNRWHNNCSTQSTDYDQCHAIVVYFIYVY